MMRKRLSTRERLRLFQESGGICTICTLRITPGIGWHLDHVIPLALGGEDAAPNLQVVCEPCHRAKTRTDVGDIRKAQRRQARHTGAKTPSRNPLPCGRQSNFKKTIDGRVIPRKTKQPPFTGP